MDIERYSAVIRMALADSAGQDIDKTAENIIQSLRIAQVLAGETPGPQKVVAIKTPTPAARPVAPKQFAGAVLIGTAPPVAGSSETEPDDMTDVWESRSGKGDGGSRLTNYLQGILPPSITLQVSGIDEPLTLMRSITGPAGMPFVHVQYGLAGQDIGPRVTLMTTTPAFDADELIADITSQAGSLYRKDKVVIQPKALAFAGVPSDADILRLAVNGDAVSGDDAMRAREDAASWGSSRPQQWR